MWFLHPSKAFLFACLFPLLLIASVVSIGDQNAILERRRGHPGHPNHPGVHHGGHPGATTHTIIHQHCVTLSGTKKPMDGKVETVTSTITKHAQKPTTIQAYTTVTITPAPSTLVQTDTDTVTATSTDAQATDTLTVFSTPTSRITESVILTVTITADGGTVTTTSTRTIVIPTQAGYTPLASQISAAGHSGSAAMRRRAWPTRVADQGDEGWMRERLSSDAELNVKLHGHGGDVDSVRHEEHHNHHHHDNKREYDDGVDHDVGLTDAEVQEKRAHHYHRGPIRRPCNEALRANECTRVEKAKSNGDALYEAMADAGEGTSHHVFKGGLLGGLLKRDAVDASDTDVEVTVEDQTAASQGIVLTADYSDGALHKPKGDFIVLRDIFRTFHRDSNGGQAFRLQNERWFAQVVKCKKTVKSVTQYRTTITASTPRTTIAAVPTLTLTATTTLTATSIVAPPDVTSTVTSTEAVVTLITTATLSITATTTITSTAIAAGPTVTTYAACTDDNLIDKVDGNYVTGGSGQYNQGNTVAMSKQECCARCQDTLNCMFFAFQLASSLCLFFTPTATAPPVCPAAPYRLQALASSTQAQSFAIGNGVCGQIAF